MMMKFFKRLLSFGIRKNRRFNVREGVYVIMENSFAQNQISNISMGGLAVNYEDNGYTLGKGSYELKLVGNHRQKVDKIPFKRVTEHQMGEVLYPYRNIKRLGLQFEGLTRVQRTQLRHFIADQTIGSA